MHYGLKQGQITQNIENNYVFKLIHLVAQCSKITNTVLFLKRILHPFSPFCYFLLIMSECPKVHFVALRFKWYSSYLTGRRESANPLTGPQFKPESPKVQSWDPYSFSYT